MNFKKIALILSLSACLGGAGFAQNTSAPQNATAQKQSPPPGGPPKPFNLPPRHRFTLSNGAHVTLVEYGSVPKAYVRVAVRTGMIDQTAEQTDLATITALLIKEGTKTRTGEQIAEEAASMGSALEASAGADQTFFDLDVLGESAPKAVRLLADVVQNPSFPEADFERIKKDQARSIAIQRSQPSGQALEAWRKMMYPNHPYGRIFPSPEMLNGYKVADVEKFWNGNFGAARTDIYVVGRFDEAAVRAAVSDAFKAWKKGDAATLNPPKPIDKAGFAFVDRPGAAQSTLYIGLPTIDPSQKDYVPLNVMDSLLGGSFGSRITSNIREQKGYTYSPYSQVSVRYRDGYWVEIADVTTAVTGASITEIRKEITRLQQQPPSDAELNGIKNYLSGLFVIRNSSRQGLLAQLDFVDLHGLGDDYLTNYVPRVNAVSTEEVQQTAEKYLPLEKISMVVVGDPEKVRPQVQEFDVHP